MKKRSVNWIRRVAVAGLALAGVAGWNSKSLGQVTNLVSDTTFEDAIYDTEGNQLLPDGHARWPWGYRYAWGNYTDPGVDPYSDAAYRYPADNPTNTCQQVIFDTSAYTE